MPENSLEIALRNLKEEYFSKKAPDQGHAGAQYELGWAYLKGGGTPIDKTAAKVLFAKSADQGNCRARRVLYELLPSTVD